MKIEIDKQSLSASVSALGKLVSRTSTIEAYRCISIEGADHTLLLRTANADESISFGIDVEVGEPFAVLVNFDDFRMIVRGARNKHLVFALEDGTFSIDGVPLRLAEDSLPPLPSATNDCISSALPAGFVELLATAAPIVDRNNYRKILQGIHLCPEGIVVTNGKELLHIPQELKIVPLTIPFPLALLTTKCEDGGVISTWTEQEWRYFRMEIGSWTWTGKALVGMYPNWSLVVPKASTLIHKVSFDEEHAKALQLWLKTVPENPPNNEVVLQMESGMANLRTAQGMTFTIAATFSETWGSFELHVNRNILLRLLSEGHSSLACPADHGPFTASGGIGNFVAMPLYCANDNVSKSENENQSVTEQLTTTNQNKEKQTMNNTNDNNTVSADVQNVVEVTPMEELTASIEAFKLKLKSVFDESNSLSRKVKEVALVQKQKERDFVLAKRAIERIRMAI